MAGGPTEWPGKGPFPVRRAIPAWPKFSYAYPKQVTVSQQYVEVVNSGDPSTLTARVSQQYIEVVSSGPPQFSYLGAPGGEWPGPGPKFVERRIPSWPQFQYAYPPPPFVNALPTLTGAAATAHAGAFGEQQGAQLVGVAATGVAGNVRDQEGANLSSVAAVGHAGAFTVPDRWIAITGAAATAHAGTIDFAKLVTLTGIAATATAGRFLPREVLSGRLGTARQNVFRPALAKQLTGVHGTGTAGTITGRLASIPRLVGIAAHGAAADLHTAIVVSGKGHGHGKGQGGSYGVTIIDVFATAKAGKLGSIVKSATATTVHLTGVAGTAAFGTFGLSVGHATAATGVAAQSAVKGLTPGLARSLVGVHGQGASGALAPRIAPSVLLTGVFGTGAADRFAVNVVSTTATLLGQPSAVAFTHIGQVRPEIDRGLTTPDVNPAIGEPGTLAGQNVPQPPQQSSRATGAAGSFGIRIDTIQPIFGVQAFSAAGSFRRDVQIALSAAAAQGRVADLMLALVLPQGPLECDLNATVSAGALGGSVAGNAIAFNVFGNDLAGDVHCED